MFSLHLFPHLIQRASNLFLSCRFQIFQKNEQNTNNKKIDKTRRIVYFINVYLRETIIRLLQIKKKASQKSSNIEISNIVCSPAYVQKINNHYIMLFKEEKNIKKWQKNIDNKFPLYEVSPLAKVKDKQLDSRESMKHFSLARHEWKKSFFCQNLLLLRCARHILPLSRLYQIETYEI